MTCRSLIRFEEREKDFISFLLLVEIKMISQDVSCLYADSKSSKGANITWLSDKLLFSGSY